MIDKTSPVPLYHQVEQDLKQDIKAKQYAVGDPIPTEVDLIARYGVSRMTIRLAIEELEKEGYVKKIQGKGTFVKSQKVTQELGVITSWSETMRAQGKEPIAEKVHKCEIQAAPELAEEMEIEPGTRLYFIERLRCVDGEPVSISQIHIIADLAPGLLAIEEIKDSVYKVLEEQYHVELSTADEVVEACAADAKQAELLQIKEGYPIIKVTRLTRDPIGKTIELSRVWTRGDKYAYKVHLSGRSQKKY